MKRIKNSRRGATLTELVVVLAVIVIASAMVVSFASLIGGHRNISDAKLEAMQDVRIAESTIEGFIESHKITLVEETQITGTDEGNQNTNSIYFENKKLVYKKTGIVNENIEIGLENVNYITFDSLPGNDGDVIYFCTVTYEDPGHDEPAKYTFCVNPYAGETIEEVTP